MTIQKRPLIILNLSGELSSELKDYFASRSVQVVDPSESSKSEDWSHILVKDTVDFDQINETYDVIEKERHIISLTKVKDVQDFTINGGNLVIDETWVSGSMGPFIMDKYFQGYGGISLGDNYPAFEELGTFNIVNPFNTGEYLDRLVHKAYECGIDGLTLKTYFDHLVMYVTGLKKKGKVGLPFEVTYGSAEGIFALQMHFYSEHLEMLDIASGLSSFSRKSEDFTLNMAVQSTDFFDFSYMPDVKKTVVTGLWSQDARANFENSGLMFSTLRGSISAVHYHNEGATSTLVAGSEIEDHTDKIVVKDNLQVVEEKMTITGDDEVLELTQIVKGKFDEKQSSTTISGNKLDVDEVALRISSSLDEAIKEKDLVVRSLSPGVSSVKTGLFNFAKSLNKNAEDLSPEELEAFHSNELPKLIKNKNKNQIQIQASTKVLNSTNHEALKAFENSLATANSENENLKAELLTMKTEVKLLKESRDKLASIQMKAAESSNHLVAEKDPDEALRKFYQQQLNDQKELNENDRMKLASLLERENKYLQEVKEEELKSRKLQIEALQKETLFSQEIESSERKNKSKDLILIKTKEVFTKLFEKKENEIADLKRKVDQLSSLTLGPSSTQTILIKDLEKQNNNLSKQVDVYKMKLSNLASNVEINKSDDSSKEELKRLQLTNKQMKNQLDSARKESEKWQNKAKSDNSELLKLRGEINNLEKLVKKMSSEKSKETEVAASNPSNDQELKRLQAQNQILETQMKDSAAKISSLEGKLIESLRLQKAASGSDDGSKVKINQLENSVKKLTQDLIENKSQLKDAKKETNKLRQEKTALQNQLDKLKKDTDRARSASPKNSGGKAA